MPRATSPIVRTARSIEHDIRTMAAVDVDDLEDALHKAAELATDEMRERVPIDTGQLKDSIKFETSEKDRDRVKVTVGFSDEGYYAHIVEYGYDRQPAQPFLRPAFDENEASLFTIINLRLRSGIVG